MIFSINGAGIANSSAFAPSFINESFIFFNSGTAANAAITNNGAVSFLGSSSAGSSTIVNSGSGSLISFSDTSTAGNATITTNGGALTQFTSNGNGGNARFITNAGGTVDFSGSSGPLGDGNISAGSIEGAGTYKLGTNRLIVGSNNLSTTVSGSIQDGGSNGSFTKTGAGTLTLTGTLNIQGDLSLCNCQTGGLVISGGSATVGSFVEVDGGTLAVTNGGTLQTVANFTDALTLTAAISGAGSLTKAGSGTLILTGISTYTGGTTITGGTLQLGDGGANGSIVGNVTNNGTFAINRSDTFTFGGAISGSGAFQQNGTGTTIFTAANTYTGGTIINAGTLRLGPGGSLAPTGALTVNAGGTFDLNSFNQTIGSLAGAGSVTLGAGTLTTGSDNTSTTFSGTISGTGGLTKIGAGTLVLTGNNPYSGATAVNGGRLTVNGAIPNSTLTVDGGATLGGTGTVGNAIIRNGTLSPGNSIGTLTVNGSLVMSAAASYLVEISPTSADRTNVGGTATLGGTVQAAFASGSYVTRAYTILSAAGGLNGTTFNALTTSNLPANFTTSLSYTATDVILNLTATLGALTTLGVPNAPSACAFSINQCNVANAINAFFNNGGALPGAFANLFGLTGVNLGNALTLLSGEAATGAQQVAFQLTNQFLGVMLDPFVDGRNAFGGGGSGALGFAPEREELPDDIALAYAKLLKAPPKPPTAFEQRWSVWGAGYGGQPHHRRSRGGREP